MNMRRTVGFGSLAVAAACLGLAGCVEENNGALFIVKAQPIEDECVVSTQTERGLGRGILDMSVGSSYVLFPLIRNTMPSVVAVQAFQTSDARLDTKSVQLRRAIVKYRARDEISVQFPKQVTLPLSGTVSNNDGLLATSVEVISPTLVRELRLADEFLIFGSQGEALAARASIDVIVSVQVEGATLDGNEITSNEFFFNITICNGCLVFFPPEAIDPESGVLSCDGAPRSDEDLFANVACPTLLGQDQGIDCRLCALSAVDPIARQLCSPAP